MRKRLSFGRAVGLSAIILVGLVAAEDARREAAQLVREGLQHFRSDSFAEAESSFAAALELVPENAIVLYDKGCAALSAGKREEARSLLRSVTVTKDRSLSAKSHYNLGILESTEARETLGDDPAAAEGETRQRAVDSLKTAVQQFRNALKREPSHLDARHNLELIRLYIKHLQSQWEERDRQKQRDEKNLLEFLKMIEQQQTAHRSASRGLVVSGPQGTIGQSAFARRSAYETADGLRTLQEEIEPLKEKISEELGSAGTGSGVPDSGEPEPEVLLHDVADRIGSELLTAADQLEANETESSIDSQTKALATTNQMYTAIAPYTDILQRAIREQGALLPGAPNAAAASEEADQKQDPVTDPTLSPGPEAAMTANSDDVEIQNRISIWANALEFKAEQQLPQAESQLQQMQSEMASAGDEDSNTDPGNNTAGSGSPAGQQWAQQEQLEGLIESMKRAIALAPEAMHASEQAATTLVAENRSDAHRHQKECHRILKEIAEPLKDNQDSEDQNQDQRNQNEDDKENKNDEKQNGDNNKSEPPEDGGDEQQEQDRSREQEQSGQQDSKSENRDRQNADSSRQRAESVLRQAAEREREHRENQKRIRALLQRAIKVDRDW